MSPSFPLIEQYSKNSDVAPGNAQGGRLSQTKDDASNNAGPLSQGPAAGTEGDANKLAKSFIMDDKGEMRGSLKIYIKLDLEADIRVIAKVKGDIAIGLL